MTNYHFFKLYQAYRNAGPTAVLIIPAVLINIPAISGILLNSIVVIITLLTKLDYKNNFIDEKYLVLKKHLIILQIIRSLRGTSNFLMAMLCFLEILHQSGHIVFLVIVISGINFISLLDVLFIFKKIKITIISRHFIWILA
jgi:hypothetical protein